MVDIHHHLLSGLDDGAKDFETSIAMARMAVDEGITHVVCTPHANGEYDFNPEVNQQKITQLRERIAAENIPLTLGLGCDFHLSYDNIQSALKDPVRYSINGHLMTEMVDESPKAVLKGGVIALQMHAGFTMDIQFKDISIKFLDGNP